MTSKEACIYDLRHKIAFMEMEKTEFINTQNKRKVKMSEATYEWMINNYDAVILYLTILMENYKNKIT